MTFRIPKGMKIAATGALLSEANEDGQNVSVWKSEAPQTVAGFSFGRFKVEEAKLTKPQMSIRSFANEESPNWVEALQQAAQGPQLGQGVTGSQGLPGAALGTMSTTALTFWNDERELLLERDAQGFREQRARRCKIFWERRRGQAAQGKRREWKASDAGM